MCMMLPVFCALTLVILLLALPARATEESPAPVALYYDPLLYIAALTFWTREQAGYLLAPDIDNPVHPRYTYLA